MHTLRSNIHAPLRASILGIPFRSRFFRFRKIQHPRDAELRFAADFRVDLNFIFPGF